MSDHLCEEVVAEILKRLPVKSVLKFTSVCKSWYALITNPNFISLHLANSSQANKIYHLFKKYCKKPEFVLHSDNDSLSEYRVLDLPSICGCANYLELVGSCRGLVCLFDRINNCLILWNPAIGEFITTSLSNICYGLFDILGFGFDRKNNDYKVVRIVYALKDTPFPPVAQIFELSSNSWKTVTSQNLEYDVYGFSRHVKLNGVFHWFARLHDDRKKMIASFDLSNEAFQKLMLPHALAELSDSDFSLTVYNQSLAVINYGEFNREQFYYLRCSIWVMKQYGAAESWTKQFTINFHNGGLWRVLRFQGNGRILIVDFHHGEIASYDPQTQRVTPLGVYGSHLQVHSYMESLVLLKGKRNNNKLKQA
ncbi:F-box/kelch-repeat protein At3g06240-like [Mercurialis annua]|uniref:F-box/kelch-repeat protein At3g06240-like n=1 Tax=Mercurialis annua TaxID=3986 RepID=UPI002160B51C|nr:F-box/kelch-repeat protein At3g06240-like [Mercurialis annua]XP_050209711.1 F-box/kelch-repeat protein At3g06240-like [Mercurialis annua]XP_050209712.1 F-box/kelch-repeat protein At3g06240-like [Mercurialis annua]XP_050209713.1 F-box/kelch-repeat protein At3g06240-like [Mercurialis annua]XP_050209714.1 F-box/kelch-repeat protein At3g06240-like [Mercurialis annua]XP_050209715.1 F-box/kelch-repeat protein At3g06240-like [Mercurialis annua]XP_050209716.1 F-box/kelch-repeat protein At3g06240-l